MGESLDCRIKADVTHMKDGDSHVDRGTADGRKTLNR